MKNDLQTKGMQTELMLLDFLYTHPYSTPPIIKEFLGISASGAYKVINRMIAKGYVVSEKYSAYFLKTQFIGITLKGIHCLSSSTGIDVKESLVFYSSNINFGSIAHTLMTQYAHIHIKSNHSNMTFITERIFDLHDFNFTRKRGNAKISDAIAVNPDENIIFAVEIELTPKKAAKYQDILYSHLKNIIKGHYTHILYAIDERCYESLQKTIMNAAIKVDNSKTLLRTSIKINERIFAHKLQSH